MPVHLIHDLGQEQLITPFARAEAVCGRELSEAHEVLRPESDTDVCPECLSWSRRNRYQNARCAVEMSARGCRRRIRTKEFIHEVTRNNTEAVRTLFVRFSS
jgi:ribosome-binding protein aMBF1 (putative translation factor)